MIYIGDRPEARAGPYLADPDQVHRRVAERRGPHEHREQPTGLGYNFEVIRAAIGSRELWAISDKLTPLAEKMAKALL